MFFEYLGRFVWRSFRLYHILTCGKTRKLPPIYSNKKKTDYIAQRWKFRLKNELVWPGKLIRFEKCLTTQCSVIIFLEMKPPSTTTTSSSGGRCCRFYCDDEFNYNVGEPILIEIETISSGCNSRPVAGNIISIMLVDVDASLLFILIDAYWE